MFNSKEKYTELNEKQQALEKDIVKINKKDSSITKELKRLHEDIRLIKYALKNNKPLKEVETSFPRTQFVATWQDVPLKSGYIVAFDNQRNYYRDYILIGDLQIESKQWYTGTIVSYGSRDQWIVAHASTIKELGQKVFDAFTEESGLKFVGYYTNALEWLRDDEEGHELHQV